MERALSRRYNLMMISPNVINSIRLSTCAVTRVNLKQQEIAKLPPEQLSKRQDGMVLATAFLVGKGLALSNRHVVLELVKEYRNLGTFEHWYLESAYPNPNKTHDW